MTILFLEMQIVSFFIKGETIDAVTVSTLRLCCKKLRSVADAKDLWSAVPLILNSGKINLPCLSMKSHKCVGTEGICVETVCKATMGHYALKKARPFPEVNNNSKYMYGVLRS